MDKPIISLVGTAIRPKLWRRMISSLRSNEIPFEVIFIGNVLPKFKLPENCHFIYSGVKPTQCIEIGIRYAVGEFIILFSDDVVFSKHALDNLYKEFKDLKDDKVMLSCRYVLRGKDIADECSKYDINKPNSPIMPIAALMKRELWKKLGGIDNRLVACYGELDIAMRVYEIGGKVVLSKNVKVEEKHPRRRYHPFMKRSNLWVEYGHLIDRPILDSFWVKKNGEMSFKRLLPVQPFKDEYILTRSQGNKGRWI